MAENTVKIVLIVGLVLLVVLIIFTLVTFSTNSSALVVAQQNLEDAITRVTSSFTQFASTMFAGLSRFVSKLRDLFVSFINKVSTAFSQTLTYLTNVITRIFRYLEHLAAQLLTFFATLYFKIEAIIVVFLEKVYGKLITVPINVSIDIILSFVSVVSSAIHSVFCFAVNGIEDFSNLLTQNVLDPLVDFFTNPNNPIISTITGYINSYVVNPISDIITRIKNLPNTILGLIQGSFGPLANIINSIRCFMYQICKPIPGVPCPTGPGQIFGPFNIAGIQYGSC
jgi:phage-related protein